MSDLEKFLESRFTYRHTDGNIYARVKDLREWMKGKVLVPVEVLDGLIDVIDTLKSGGAVVTYKVSSESAVEAVKLLKEAI